jgi:hypothetical protein
MVRRASAARKTVISQLDIGGSVRSPWLKADIRSGVRHVGQGQNTTWSLLNHLVGTGEDIGRDFEAECLGGPMVYDELEARRLFDR